VWLLYCWVLCRNKTNCCVHINLTWNKFIDAEKKEILSYNHKERRYRQWEKPCKTTYTQMWRLFDVERRRQKKGGESDSQVFEEKRIYLEV
jgi:hypothetical protein